MNRVEKIVAILANLDLNELIEVHNDYCYEVNATDNTIYRMDDLDEYLDGYTPSEIAYKIFNGDFKPCDKYFVFDGYNNLLSFNYESDANCKIYVDEIADYIDEYETDFNIFEVSELFEEA